MTGTRKKVLAVSSGGGHWIELLRIMPAFEDCDVIYATVRNDYRADVPGAAFFVVNHADRRHVVKTLLLAFRVLFLVLRLRPDIVVSAGAAPGYFALRFGKMIGARTIWLDSLANVDDLSKSGHMVRRYADLWLTQWPQLAGPGGPEYAGKVI
ncbi:MAG TPA: hypothetical protein VF816_11290 [Rhodocyclaceae bacterium]